MGHRTGLVALTGVSALLGGVSSCGTQDTSVVTTATARGTGEPKQFARDAKCRGSVHITSRGRNSPVGLWANRRCHCGHTDEVSETARLTSPSDGSTARLSGIASRTFARVVAQYRPRKDPESFLQLSKLPAKEAQVDWGRFGSVQLGLARRNLYAFVMTLSWSRMTWLQFFFDMQMANFQKGHVDAFSFFGGVPRKLLFDNLKSAIVERDGNAIRVNQRLLQLASHCDFEPRAAAPRRGNEKGRVERSIRYVRDNFFAAREFHDIRRLNEEARAWSLGAVAQRRWPQDDTRRVSQVFAEERSKPRPLPHAQFPAHERKTASVGRTPWLRFDTNNYSVPPRYVRRAVDVIADHEHICVVADGKLIAEHQRSFDRRASIEDPSPRSSKPSNARHGRPALEMASERRRLQWSSSCTEELSAGTTRAGQPRLSLGCLIRTGVRLSRLP